MGLASVLGKLIMKYSRTCGASGMFASNNVMSFNEIWRKRLYNVKQRVTKVTILLLRTDTILPGKGKFIPRQYVLGKP